MSVDEEKGSSESSLTAPDREWLRDKRTVTISVQDVANRMHQDMYGADAEHLAIHSCPCHVFAAWYLGVEDKPKMYWPKKGGGNEWEREIQKEVTVRGLAAAIKQERERVVAAIRKLPHYVPTNTVLAAIAPPQAEPVKTD